MNKVDKLGPASKQSYGSIEDENASNIEDNESAIGVSKCYTWIFSILILPCVYSLLIWTVDLDKQEWCSKNVHGPFGLYAFWNHASVKLM